MKTIERLFNPKLRTGLRVLRSFLPWRDFTKTPPKGCLQIKLHRQWTTYSCTAAVAQMVLHYYGIKVSHREAINLTDCRPDGAYLADVAKKLRLEYGFKIQFLKSAAGIRRALRRGEPVITNDSASYVEDHAILLVGETPKGFWIADPAICEIYWRHEKQFLESAGEFIAVSRPKIPPP